MDIAIILLLAYLIGSIPFGLILTKAAGLGDIRQIGSGNIGATNVLRTGNKKLAALTLFLDGLKGFAAVRLALYYAALIHGSGMIGVYAGLAALIGHMFPIWLKFKGGKGVATILGVALGLDWLLGAMACATWLVMALAFRYSSLSALVAIAALPAFAWYLGYGAIVLPLAVMAALVWWRHRENIKRLLNGAEPRIGQKK